MTGPDVLIVSKSWVDEDQQRAIDFMRAYFESVTWVKENEDKTVKIVAGKYIHQGVDQIDQNMKKFIWHDLAAQKHVMTRTGIFGQADYVVRILYEEMGVIPIKPDFMQWVNMDILPFDSN